MMAEQLNLSPDGLTRSQFERLSECARQASSMTTEQLRAQVDEHVTRTASAHDMNRLVNLRLAEAIRDIVVQVAEEWGRLPEQARYWLAGATLYFVNKDDDEPDFSSAIGFEDDVEVLNACLRFSRLDPLCLNPEDYDA